MGINSDGTNHCFGESIEFFTVPKHFDQSEFIDLKVNSCCVMTCLLIFWRFSQKNSQIFEADVLDEVCQMITLQGIGHETRRKFVEY